jgi:hypothetical protein
MVEIAMSKTRTLVTLAATALATLFIASSSFEPAVAKDGHGGYSGGGAARSSSGGGMKSFSGGGMRAYSSGRSYGGGTQKFSRTFKSPSVGSSRVYAYKSHPGRHRHHFRGRTFVYGYPYVDGYYDYSDGCYWLRRRALATGSSYWWDRYYDCISGNDYY